MTRDCCNCYCLLLVQFECIQPDSFYFFHNFLLSRMRKTKAKQNKTMRTFTNNTSYHATALFTLTNFFSMHFECIVSYLFFGLPHATHAFQEILTVHLCATCFIFFSSISFSPSLTFLGVLCVSVINYGMG